MADRGSVRPDVIDYSKINQSITLDLLAEDKDPNFHFSNFYFN